MIKGRFDIKSIKKWSPSFHIADIFSLLKYDYYL